MNHTARRATFRIALSAVVIALYFSLMLLSQSFAFGAYQIRVATALYALAAPFPFLVVPLGIANCLSNLLGGMLWDVLGGFFVGILTAGSCALLGKIKFRFSCALIILPILVIPTLVVPLWLSPLLSVPYAVLAVSLLVGQSVPSVLGAVLVAAIGKRFDGLKLGLNSAKRPTDKKQSEPVVVLTLSDTNDGIKGTQTKDTEIEKQNLRGNQ